MSLLTLRTTAGVLALRTPSPAGAGTYVLSDYTAEGADPTGISDSTDALEAALVDVKAYAAANGSATLDLGGAANTWRLHPRDRSELGSQGQAFNYGVCLLLVSVSGITITGTSAVDRPTILMDAQPATEGGEPRDPTLYIDAHWRGEFIHVDDGQDITFSHFIVDGQAPPTVATNNWGIPGYGWDFSHKGAVVQYGSDNVQFLTVDMQDFRSEFVYANGDAPLVGSILIDGGTWTGTTASMFSCTANLTVQNLTVRKAPQGIENYAYDDMTTTVTNCDVNTAGTYYQDYNEPYLNMQSGVSYTIEDNSGGADWTNVGAPDNNVGTTFTASSNDLPTSWGTGQLSRYVDGNGIVIFNERGSGTTSITGTDVADSNAGILITDFAHNWTISNCTFTDVSTGILLSNQATSSTSANWHLNAGWRDFNISNITVTATGRTVSEVFRSDGSSQTKPYVNSAEAALNGYYSITSYDTNGKHAYTRDGSSVTISWSGTQWEIKDGATTYYTSTDAVQSPYDVTTWTQVSGVNTPLVTIHAPRDWTVDGITIVEENGFSVQSVFRSKVGFEGTTVANTDASGTAPVAITAGDAPVHWLPKWLPTCTLPFRTDYVSGSPDDYTPRWGAVAFNANPDTTIQVLPDAYPYLPDGFEIEAKSSNATEITLQFTGSGGPDSVAFTNAATKTLVFTKATQTFAEVV
jgi:hypothetical protein